MKKTITVSLMILLMISSLLSSCSQEINDIPDNLLVGKWEYSHLIENSVEGKYEETEKAIKNDLWEYSHLIENSVEGKYEETEKAIKNDLQNRWTEVEQGAFTYEFTSDMKFLYNGTFLGNYIFTGSGIIISNMENDRYVDEGSFQFSFDENQLIILLNQANEYRDENNQYANIELLKSLGVTTSLDTNQPIYGAWVKLAFNKIK